MPTTRLERSAPRCASLILALALVACTQGPDVAGLYRVQEYRENTLSCDEVGHVGSGPSHIRLVSEFGGRSLKLERCPTDADSCASSGPLSAIRFMQGDASGWKGDHSSSLAVGSSCTLRRRVDQLVVDERGRLHLELRSWSWTNPAGYECETETVEKLSDESACERYEVLELEPVTAP